MDSRDYMALSKEERLAYDWIKSIRREVLRKGIHNLGQYFITLSNCRDKEGKIFNCVDIDGDGDMYYIKGGEEKVYSNEWSCEDAVTLGMYLRYEVPIFQAKDMWNKPLYVGDSVIFTMGQNWMVKALIKDIKLGKNDDGCRIYLTDTEVGYTYLEPFKTGLKMPKYKKPNSLVKIN